MVAQSLDKVTKVGLFMDQEKAPTKNKKAFINLSQLISFR